MHSIPLLILNTGLTITRAVNTVSMEHVEKVEDLLVVTPLGQPVQSVIQKQVCTIDGDFGQMPAYQSNLIRTDTHTHTHTHTYVYRIPLGSFGAGRSQRSQDNQGII